MKRSKYTSARRLISVLSWLNKREKVCYQRIMKEFGVSYAQARDDISMLKEVCQLEKFREDRQLFFQIRKDINIPALVARSTMLSFGRASLELWKGTIYEKEMSELCEELKSLLPSKEAFEVDAITRSFHHRYIQVSQGINTTEVLEDIITCFHRQKSLFMNYFRLYDGERENYTVGPVALVLWRDQLQLIAQKTPFGPLRSFDVEGIRKTDVIRGSHFIPPNDFDVKEIYKSAIGRYIDFPEVDVILQVRGIAANFLRRTRVHESQKTQELKDVLRVELRVGQCPDLKSWIIGMIPEVTIEKPLSLKEEIKNVLEEGIQVI